MARLPVTEEELIARYGPHLNEAPPGGWDARPRVDRVVEHPLLLLRPAVRHQAEGARQRGRRLRALVRVPVQRGQALPEGREALPPGQPPRPAVAPDGARPVVARRLPADRVGRRARPRRRPRSAASRATYGDDAFAMLSGVSLTNEKSYLIGKFARLALHTANLDYNGRFCMVSAGAGNKKALGVDRSPNPWSDIPLADVVWVAGIERRRDFPDHDELHLAGARPRARADRAGPTCRPARPHRRPVPPGPPGIRLGALRRGAPRADPQRLARPRVHRRPHRRLRPGRRRGRGHDPGVGGRRSPACPPQRIEQAAEWWGTSATGMLLHARRHRAADEGRRQRRWRRSTSASRPASSASPAAACRRSPARATARAGASTATSATSSPATATSRNPEHRAAHRRACGAATRRDPRQGHPRPGDHRGDPRGRDQGSAVDLLQPGRVGARLELHRGGARQARVLRRDRLLPVRVGQHADVVLARLAARGGRGHLDHAARGASSRSTRRSTRPARRAATGRSCSTSRTGWARASTSRTRTPSRSSRSCASRRPAEPPTTAAPPGSASRTRWACSGRSPRSATPARRACSRAASSSTPTARPASTACRSASRPRSSTTSTRSG